MNSGQSRWRSAGDWWWLWLLTGSWLGILYTVIRQEAHPGVSLASLVCFAAGGLGAVVRMRRSERMYRASVVQLWLTMQHGLLNHLQVVSGWLQLDQPDRAQAFIAGLTGKIDCQRAFLNRIGRLGLDSRLVTVIGQAEAAGIELRLSVEGEGFPERRAALTMVQLIEDLVQAAVDAGGSASGVSLAITSDDGSCRLVMSFAPPPAFDVAAAEQALTGGGWSHVSVEQSENELSIYAAAMGW